ncbi:MarR family transcriptional regulator [Nesterenkonia alkaliphila]|nr:MarR family transcriptional regulator [Nesterenkonia alkaliphila]
MENVQMGTSESDTGPEEVLLDPRVMDPTGALVNLESMDQGTVDEALEVLRALRAWHQAERRMNQTSQRYMKLGENDMRALRWVIAGQRSGKPVTPTMIAQYLGISTASVTKMLDRLERAGHIRRHPHPADRRSSTVEVTEATQQAARDSVGRSHAERFRIAAEMSPEERAAVIRFLEALTSTESSAGP